MNCIAFLNYREARTAVEWLDRAFGFDRSTVHQSKGQIAHAELRFGDSMVMLGAAFENGWGMRTPGELGGVNQGVYVIVDDIEAQYERARGANAEIVRPLADTDYGSREFMARDPEGNIWSFGTYRPEPA